MKNILILKTSLNGDDGNSNKLVETFKNELPNDGVRIIERDLAEQNLSHLTKEEMQSWMTDAEERSERQKTLAAISDALVEELKAADYVILGLPMYNFGMPSVFKAWIDRVARAGITFKYTENGPVGLLEDKPVIVLAARGGQYQGSDRDTQTPYIRNFMAFLGLESVEFVYAEGLAMGDDSAKDSFSNANEKIRELIAKTVA